MASKRRNNMSFKFYKFCQSALITIPCVVFSATLFLCNISEIHLLLCLLIGVFATFFWFLPILSFFYPIAFTGYIIAALVSSFSGSSWQTPLLIALLILHIVRLVCMLTFAYKNPETSQMYDTAIRNGYDL